jgi:hypothetical protein
MRHIIQSPILINHLINKINEHWFQHTLTQSVLYVCLTIIF